MVTGCSTIENVMTDLEKWEGRGRLTVVLDFQSECQKIPIKVVGYCQSIIKQYHTKKPEETKLGHGVMAGCSGRGIQIQT